jgi:hypothetical protein
MAQDFRGWMTACTELQRKSMDPSRACRGRDDLSSAARASMGDQRWQRSRAPVSKSSRDDRSAAWKARVRYPGDAATLGKNTQASIWGGGGGGV